MNFVTILGIALALAMDAFAVSVASGITIRNLRVRHALMIATSFGLFQAVMPIIGWFGGVWLRRCVGCADRWIAFWLLTLIGVKMVYESFKIEAVEKKSDPLDVYVLFALSIATSIDALAAGISFAVLDVSIVTPVLVIGAVTFVLSFAGVWIGERFGHFFERRMELVAGLLLIAIGLKILLTHSP